MNDIEFPHFRTKTGICEITPDDIVLTRTGLRGRLAETIVGSNSVGRILFFLSLAGGSMVAMGGLAISRGELLHAAPMLLIGLGMLFSAYRSRNNVAIPVIPRASIQQITARGPVSPLTRAHFIVKFEHQGKTATRLIILPGAFQNGRAEYEKALNAFEAAGLKVG
ncbi:MAG: hypothetical protein NXI22_14220 [bacterium]|nr:hypothetical protein [bacterium]